jgi:hypothetical protein
MGVAAMQRQVVSSRLLINICKYITLLLFIIVTGIIFYRSIILDRIQSIAGQEAANLSIIFPWTNPALCIPLLISIFAIIVVIYWHNYPSLKIIKFIVVFVLILDLGSFGWFYEWQYYSPKQNLLTSIDTMEKYAQLLNITQQRMLPVRGGLADLEEIPVNMSRLWGVPSASGYGPLILSRVSRLLSMGTIGDVSPNWANETDKSLDIMSIRYVFTPNHIAPVSYFQGLNWSTENLATSLGSGCGKQQPNSVKFSVPSGKNLRSANAIGVVSSLLCATDLTNNAEVLKVRANGSNGNITNLNLLAGRDTSEWSYNCDDVLPLVQHNQAKIFASFPYQRDGIPNCKGHNYVTILPLNKFSDIQSLELNWVGDSGAIGIQKINLIDTINNISFPITEDISYLSNTQRWQYVENINQASVYENLRAMPRLWLVPEVITMQSEEVLNSIKSSKLPDGRTYEPSQIALVEERIDFKPENFDLAATANLTQLNDTHIKIKTNSISPTFLVLSDIYYPGWKAKIDGKLTHVFQTNYVLRGIVIPEGNHIVEFEFKPISFHIGVGVSTAALLLLVYLTFKQIRKPKLVTGN